MGLMKKLSFILLLVSASAFSLSFAGRPTMSIHKPIEETESLTYRHQEVDDETSIHERLLRMNTRDYGSYSPSPRLVRPPFKLIPN
ncbi:PREDICTED: uncharacterized protein LOC104819621 [Tarenaya hassleriana]|uniref:uncharacterized protein LOC104819621 n=1 Tax=Tarenaya hassleriana TaxID=28532 RepID=UPI00053C70AA|nr:PREDICTED: uncharacterized protein LOC104819621 [Tarenaya hassleriana]